jgi:uncharacterized LabA/DUF88 family protein
MDACQNRFDTAIVISGDSDLITPIRMAKEELGKNIIVLNPQLTSGLHRRNQHRANAGLKEAASFYKNGISDNQIKQALFPSTLTDQHGTITKPPNW